MGFPRISGVTIFERFGNQKSYQFTWDRALGYSLERPKSLTTDMLEEIAGIKKE